MMDDVVVFHNPVHESWMTVEEDLEGRLDNFLVQVFSEDGRQETWLNNEQAKQLAMALLSRVTGKAVGYGLTPFQRLLIGKGDGT